MARLPETLPYCHIDAFAERPFAGNQAAVMPLESWPDDALMQAIGEENNFAETAFIVPADNGEADFELRWFTPAVEIALCGHATLAAGHYVFENGFAGDAVRFATRKAGVLVVTRSGDLLALSLPAYAPAPAPLPDWTAALGALPAEYHVYPGDYHVLLFDHADDVLALAPDMKTLGALGDHQFICTAPGKDTDVLSRVFVPGAGVDEDSVTGSAHAVLTPFWAARLGRESFSAFQASRRGGRIECTLAGDRAVLAGRCVTVVTGTFRLG